MRANKALVSVLIFMFVIGLVGLSGPGAALAVVATAPSLGAASTFSALGVTLTADGSGATVSGDIGYTTKTGAWTHTGGSDFTAGAQAGAISAAAAAWTSMGSGGGTTWDPVANTSPAPGLWTVVGDATFSGTLTLNGSATDVWIFQINSSLTFTGTVVLTGGAQACNVYWRVASSATINGNTGNTFVGTLIANSNVSVVTAAGSSTINGRLVATTGTLSTAGVTSISGPSCAAAPGGTRRDSTITVVKHVVNDSGGTKTVADFPLFINGVQVTSGVSTNYPAPSGTYTVTESNAAGYNQVFSGDCDANGQMTLNSGQNLFCILTNNDIGTPVVPIIPPLIDVVKVPSPLALPGGPGPVTYTYTLRNIGTVPVTNVTMVGDTCSPIILQSGDTNGDSILQTTETWVYRCTTTLSATHTNTVVATGRANGITATDIASSTVVVGAPIVPPLIHVTKVPSPLALASGGGMVTYTKRVTNPGTVPLSNVRLTDDKCSPVTYVSGDTNGDSMLQPGETWVYTCRTNLTATTINTVTAAGDANGLTARDFAIATVVVAVPRLPSTGLPPEQSPLWAILFASIFTVVSTALVVALRKRTA